MYKLLTLDLDGTTLDSQKKIPHETIEALKKLRSMNVEVAIASGRGVAELIDYREMTDEIRFAILLSGALVYDCQELKPVAYRAIDPKLQREIIQAGIDENAMVQILTSGKSICRQIDIDHMDDFAMGIYHSMYERVCERCENFFDVVEKYSDEICKINIYHRSIKSCDVTQARLKKFPLEVVRAEELGLEMNSLGISKAVGLRDLCEHLKIDLSEVISIGDAYNDLELLKIVGRSVAMGNAEDQVKKIADEITLTNDENGVLATIRKYFGGDL